MARLVGVCLAAMLLVAAVSYAADVTVGGYVQYQYTAKQKTDLSTNFGFKAARLKGSVKLTDKISTMVLIDATKQPSLLETNVEYVFAPIAVARFGQFQIPFGYETQNSNFDVEAIDRSQIVTKVWTSSTASGYFRDQGLMLMGRRKILEYKIACVNGTGLNTSDNNNTKDIVARIGLGIPMFAGLGFSIYEGKSPDSQVWKTKGTDGKFVDSKKTPLIQQDRKAKSVDLYLDTGKVLLEGEYIWASGQIVSEYTVKTAPDTTAPDSLTYLRSAWAPDDYSGYYVILGYRVTPLIEPVFKYDRYDPNNDKDDDQLTNLYFGVNLNFEGKARLKTFYVVKQEPDAAKVDNNMFMMQVEAKF